MADDYLQKTLHVIQTIKDVATQRNDITPQDVLHDFIEKFYLRASANFLQNHDEQTLYAISKGVWDFAQNRADVRHLRVYNPTLERDGWESNRTVLELNTADSPFLLDSITAELVRLGYRIYAVMHPVMDITRDEDNSICKITPYSIEKDIQATGKPESVMHIQLSHIENEQQHRDLEEKLHNVLTFVRFAVDDWKPICAKAEDLITHITQQSQWFDEDHITEVKEFMEWVLDNNFIFLGYQEYDFIGTNGQREVKPVENSEMGIFRASENESRPVGLQGISWENIGLDEGDRVLVEITKSSKKSIVHRAVQMDYIGIKRFDEQGNLAGEYRLLGLFTSAVYYQSAMHIPIIRQKIKTIMERSALGASSHSGKALMTVLESYPRDEMLQVEEKDLFLISMGMMELAERPRTKIFIREDRFQRFVSCLVFVQREQFNTNLRENIQGLLEESFAGTVSDYYTQVTDSPLARIHVLVKLNEPGKILASPEALERRLHEITSSWKFGLHDALVERMDEKMAEQLEVNYAQAFPKPYRESYHFGSTVCDIQKIEQSYSKERLTVALYQYEESESDIYQLKIYHPRTQAVLTEIMPILEHMGFDAIDERTFLISPSHQDTDIWVHHFSLKLHRYRSQEGDNSDRVIDLDTVGEEFERSLYYVWNEDTESDSLNKLILRAKMKSRDIEMLRAYMKYMRQTELTYSTDYMAGAIARHPVITSMLVELFHARFSPKLSASARRDKQDTLIDTINQLLAKVTNISEDRILRQLFDMMLCTLRTNYYQLDKEGKIKPYISFKIDSKKVPNLPLPRPNVEIFVYSRDMEGVHLRGGKVARGGLRWSDRIEDFRTEVLGLVKAQMVKNSVIVPVGSKGGFVVKHPTTAGREAYFDQGKACYTMYLSGLLDVTDNMVKGENVPPHDVVCYDEPDPYLVVAADKGTATFSDIANSVAQSYGFWLDDAFASGGSDGYDHKKMGITARGAWVSVKRHFMEMGINCQEEDFTCVGVGDMGGDVFGNGMLLSKHIRLVAAFNHMHIFIDPNPDSATSYQERERLFNLPRSSWTDYDHSLISHGGGIFERSMKSIPISKEVAELLNIQESELSPEHLINKIIKADVDLLWNGGIGTYVKAESESHEAAGDKANDAVRVNAKELQCKIIGEGGNLGLTQKARIEAARHGVRVNTDAIDNSAGVDCSDHEVNIKIALKEAMERGQITLEERNTILADMTDTVADLVLRDNELQTLMLTIAEHEGPKILEEENRLMHSLEEEGLLDRQIEFLPGEDEFAHLQAVNHGLTRPELSVTMAYAKMSAFNDLISSNMPDGQYYEQDILTYFPEVMQEKFQDQIIDHPLKREIIATMVSNSIVNRMGSAFFTRVKEDTGMKGCDVARAYTVARDVFECRKLWNDIAALDGKVSIDVQVDLYHEIRRLISHISAWVLRHCDHPIDAAILVEEFFAGVRELEDCLDDVMSPIIRKVRDTRLETYKQEGVPSELAHHIANLEAMSSACDIVRVARESKLTIKEVAEIYFSVGLTLRFGWLRKSARELMSHSHWENLAIKTLTDQLYDQQMAITAEVTKNSCSGESCQSMLEGWCERNQKNLERYEHFMQDLKRYDFLSQAMLTVAIQRSAALV